MSETCASVFRLGRLYRAGDASEGRIVAGNRGSLSSWLIFTGSSSPLHPHGATAPATMAEGDGLVSVDYEVFGKVQGVFFRKHTQAQGKKLGVVGWVQNTDYGSVRGQIQGPTAKVRQLQEWLKKTGSPKSEIDRAEFRNEKKIARLEHSDFCIVK
ncbi:acylphosphatase-1 isoform X1 [Varanus komodoensis]|nr:acylphosphatase-1 isoform X1 [Varanus komodoensis]